MITTESSEREMLDALHRATGDLLAALDTKACFLTLTAMQRVGDVRKIRKTITHARRQRSDDDDGSEHRPVE